MAEGYTDNPHNIWEILPYSKITDALKQNSSICNEVIKGKNLDNRGVYSRFFKAVRENKESGDNL